jgi:hypothetical protein
MVAISSRAHRHTKAECTMQDAAKTKQLQTESYFQVFQMGEKNGLGQVAVTAIVEMVFA